MRENVRATIVRKLLTNHDSIKASSGNVFADFGFHNAQERLLKAKLATEIAQLIEKKGRTQAQNAQRTALD